MIEIKAKILNGKVVFSPKKRQPKGAFLRASEACRFLNSEKQKPTQLPMFICEEGRRTDPPPSKKV